MAGLTVNRLYILALILFDYFNIGKVITCLQLLLLFFGNTKLQLLVDKIGCYWLFLS